MMSGMKIGMTGMIGVTMEKVDRHVTADFVQLV